MIIKSATVRKKIKDIWPDLKFMVLSDPEWWLPDHDEVIEMIHEIAIDRLLFVPHLFECEEFSLAFVVAVRGRRADLATSGKLPREQWRNWPLGHVVGTKFNGQTVDHWINFCLTKQGPLIIESQNGETWQPTQANDKIYFLEM